MRKLFEKRYCLVGTILLLCGILAFPSCAEAETEHVFSPDPFTATEEFFDAHAEGDTVYISFYIASGIKSTVAGAFMVHLDECVLLEKTPENLTQNILHGTLVSSRQTAKEYRAEGADCHRYGSTEQVCDVFAYKGTYDSDGNLRGYVILKNPTAHITHFTVLNRNNMRKNYLYPDDFHGRDIRDAVEDAMHPAPPPLSAATLSLAAELPAEPLCTYFGYPVLRFRVTDEDTGTYITLILDTRKGCCELTRELTGTRFRIRQLPCFRYGPETAEQMVSVGPDGLASVTFTENIRAGTKLSGFSWRPGG